MLRIAHATPFFDPEYYGSHEFYMSSELVKKGHSVTIITSDRHSLWGGAIGLKRKFPHGKHKYADITVCRLRTCGRVLITPLILGVVKILEAGEYDVVLTHEFFHYISYLSAVAARKLGIPLLLFQHGYSRGRRPLHRLLFDTNLLTTGRFVLNSATKILALSKESQRMLLQLGCASSSVMIMPNGVDVHVFNYSIEDRTSVKKLLFVGRLVKEKGIYALIDAFKDILQIFSKLELVIIGAGPEEKNLRHLCNDMGIMDKVKFAGRVRAIDMPQEYKSSSLLVLPTLTSEPFGNVVLESMACGRPVIASNLGGMRDTIIDAQTGFKIEPGNNKQLRDRILLLLKDDRLRIRMGQKARSWVVDKFSWDSIGLRINAVIHECVQKVAT